MSTSERTAEAVSAGCAPPPATVWNRTGCFLRVTCRAGGRLLCAFLLLNIVGEAIRPGFDANGLWLPDALVARWPMRFGLIVVGAAALWGLVRRPRHGWRRWATFGALAALLLLVLWDMVGFYAALNRGAIRTAVPVPFSSIAAACLAVNLWRVGGPRRPGERVRGRTPRLWRHVRRAAAYVFVFVVFFLGLFFLEGRTCRPRPADCALVLGAGVLSTGRPNALLMDRVRDASNLWHDGRVSRLILTGGPSGREKKFMETEAMAWAATELFGVPPHALTFTDTSHSTWQSVQQARRIMRENGWRDAVVVTQEFHLPRALLTCKRAGVTAYGHPANRRSFRWSKEPYLIVRETAAWVFYYLRPLFQPLERTDEPPP